MKKIFIGLKASVPALYVELLQVEKNLTSN